MNSVFSIVFLLELHLFLGTDTWINGYHLLNLDNMLIFLNLEQPKINLKWPIHAPHANINRHLNSFTAIKVQAGTKNSRPMVFFTQELVSKHNHNHKHKHPHHGKLAPPPAGQILQLNPFQRMGNMDEGLVEGAFNVI